MTSRDKQYFTFPGELLMRMLQMLVLPLITSSLISGCRLWTRRLLGNWGSRLFAITRLQPSYLCSSVHRHRPGWEITRERLSAPWWRGGGCADCGCLSGSHEYKTVYSKIKSLDGSNLIQTNDTAPMPGTSEGVNILGLLVFCIAFGLILDKENEAKPLRHVFDCLNKATVHLISIVIWYSPVRVLFLIAGPILKLRDSRGIGLQIAMYALTVIPGLFIHSFIILPLNYLTVTRKNPFRFMTGILPPLGLHPTL